MRRPTPSCYAQLQVAVTEAPAPRRLPRASWGELVGRVAPARRSTTCADEYDALFLGIGKPEVFLYGSYYLAGTLNEKPLVALRDDLRALGLDARRGDERDRGPHRLACAR